VEREQIDQAISELETRLERLRALYEHYFMGIERIEPSVPRKDVERRVAELRKARFQSTAQRFKFQTIVQRYNTMQQHWSRICREIELGTFRRHRLKAERSTRTATPVPRADAFVPDAQDERRAPLDSFVDGDFPALEIGTGTAPVVEGEEVAAAQPEPAATPAAGVLRRLQGSGSVPLAKGLLASLPPDLAARAQAKLPPPPGKAGALPRSPDPSRPQPLPPAPTTGARAAAPAASPPAAASPAPAARAAAAPPAPPAAPAGAGARPASPAPTASGSLPEARVRALHEAYLAARKQTNASAVSFEKLERSLRETESKLRTSHQGRAVDFEVVIKDGKAILKPKLT